MSTEEDMSGVAGTQRYLAPEWTLTFDQTLQKTNSELSSNSVDSLKKQDIYAMGIILSDLICNTQTGMEAMKIDDAIK